MTDKHQQEPFTELTDEDLDKVAGGVAGGGKGPPSTIIVKPSEGKPTFYLEGDGTGPPDLAILKKDGTVKPPDGRPPGT